MFFQYQNQYFLLILCCINIDFNIDFDIDFAIDFDIDFDIDFHIDVDIDFHIDFDIDFDVDFSHAWPCAAEWLNLVDALGLSAFVQPSKKKTSNLRLAFLHHPSF